MEAWRALIGPLGFAARSLRRRGFHSYLAFLGLTLTVATTTFLLLLGQDLATRLGIDSSMRSTFGISWLIFAYLVLALGLISIVGLVSSSYLVSSMIGQRMRPRKNKTLVLRSEEHTSELQSRGHLVCRLLLEKIKLKLLVHQVQEY